MFQIIICDDTQQMQDKYTKLVSDIMNLVDLPYQISNFYSGEELLFKAQDPSFKADLIFLDIEMTGITGIETGRKIRELKIDTDIVYLTVCKDYVFDSFDSFPLNYILKNEFNVTKIQEVITKAINRVQKKNDQKMKLFNGKKEITIYYNQIIYIDYTMRKTVVHCLDDQLIEASTKINEIDQQYHQDNFLRIHKSVIVNLKYVKYLKTNEVIMHNDLSLPVGRKYYPIFKEKLTQYLTSMSNSVYVQ